MTTLLSLLSQYVFSGIPSDAAWDLIKLAWERANDRTWEELYLEAFQRATSLLRPRLARYADGDVELDDDMLRRVLHQDLAISVDSMSVGALTAEQFTRELAAALCQRQVLIIGGHNLAKAEYAQLVSNLVEQAAFEFRESVLRNESAFREAVLKETWADQALRREVWAYLSTRFELVFDRLGVIEKKTDDLIGQVQSLEGIIKQYLGLDRPREIIAEVIKADLGAVPQGSIFGPGGFCSGYVATPMPDRYFVAQEFSPDRDDLRQALAAALAQFGVQPVRADDFLWPGHILCKISAMIQSTPFGVYQLTTSQDRNVYLELGIAVGLGRPFVLVRDKGAEEAPLTQGLGYYPISSYLELHYELGHKLLPMLTSIANYRLPPLPIAGSQLNGVIAHGDIEVEDFCVRVAKVVAGHGLTPVILGSPMGKLTHYLNREGISHRIIGGAGKTRLDETVAAIQSARFGIYRLDEACSADAFLSLGVSIGLNRPMVLVHRATSDIPSNVKGLSALPFTALSDLEEDIGAQIAQLMGLTDD